MSFILTEEQEELLALVRKFSEKEILPYAHQMDVEAHFVPGLIQKIADLGFMGINVPEEYGGVGADEVTKALVIMEFAKYDASVAELLAVHTLSSNIILKHGTPEQKEKYLTKACTGAVGAFALTEPNAGSDAAAAKTKAIFQGDEYIINGSKCFISNMGQDEGDYVILIVLTDPEKKTKGMSAIIVDRDTPGFTVPKTEDKMGLRAAPVSELYFDECHVYLADMATKTEAAKALTLNAAALRQAGKNITKEAAMAKYYASETAVEVANKALQIHGGYGYMKEYAIERQYRDARIIPIYEGTSEVQKMVISRAVINGK